MISKAIATIVAWVMFAGISISSVAIIDGWGIVVAVAAAFPLFGLMAFVWMDEVDFHKMEFKRHTDNRRATDEDYLDESVKRKRQHLDAVLRNLSDAQLRTLKQRLSDGTIDDEMLYRRIDIGDDGELEFKEINQ